MEYYTLHEIIVYDENLNELSDSSIGKKKIIEDIEKQTGYNMFEDSTKWYSCENDIKKISKINPNQYIVIRGDGEDSLDFWQKIFKEGNLLSEWSFGEIEWPSIEKPLFKTKKYDKRKLNILYNAK